MHRSHRSALTVLAALAMGCGSRGSDRSPSPNPRANPAADADETGCLARVKPGPFAMVDRALCADLDNLDVPGAVVAIYHEERTHVFVAGRTCRDRRQPVTPRTRFRLGSLTKLVVAATAARLSRRDPPLDLDAPIVAFLPDLAPDLGADPPTLRELLLHRGGLADLEPTPQNAGRPASRLPITRPHPPGTFHYANVNYALAGAALVAATGRDLDTLLEGTVNTGRAPHLAAGEPLTDTACGHLPGGPPLSVAQDYRRHAHDADWAAPAGAAVMAAPDLLELLRTAQPLELPLSPFARPHGTSTLRHHRGDTGTFWSAAWWLDDGSFAVVIVANTGVELRATLAAALALIDARPGPPGVDSPHVARPNPGETPRPGPVPDEPAATGMQEQ